MSSMFTMIALLLVLTPGKAAKGKRSHYQRRREYIQETTRSGHLGIIKGVLPQRGNEDGFLLAVRAFILRGAPILFLSA